MIACIFLQNLIHFVTALLFLRRFDGLSVAVFDGLYLFVVGVEPSDHVPDRLDFLDELLIYLVFLLIVLVLFFVVEVVFGGRTAHESRALGKGSSTDLSSWRRSIIVQTASKLYIECEAII